ncbi:MAG: isoleucine--tRNA ligase [Oscillospiraceae bacterium]|jgi:isoleucyl-tRNA synthetase|nr:isoleucine--tRNA ligase [Oscillospiraceae bacterium]
MCEPKDYSATLNLPETKFPMRANLPQREPEMLARWEADRIYYKLRDKAKGREKYILHDGPPYANGDIHIGTALNKILKDIIVKYKTMAGFDSPYIPGWDCHGLPIELAAQKKLGKAAKTADVNELRRLCREFALSCLDGQKAQFKRLGVWGDFDEPYVTIDPSFEAVQAEMFGEMYKNGYIYKGLKPVYWCADCKTALAEAEIEYQDDDCDSIYVKFPITDDKGLLEKQGVDKAKAFVAIWTTTTWTLPGNLAISLNPAFEYTFIKTNGEYLLVSRELAEQVATDCGITDYELVGSFLGKELELIETAHPFLPRKSLVIVGNHVTAESGTGCVHTAPGFGLEDYEVCQSYKDLFQIIVPVDERGRMTEEAGANIAGLRTSEANKIIADDLTEKGLLVAKKHLNHSYPHCWRCQKPIIYRATPQWFCAVDKFVDKSVKAVEETRWIPEWGEERIRNMLVSRSDWCISRQRRWGVPIPVLYCKDCGKELVNDKTIAAISSLFRAESSDAWYAKDPSEFLPSDIACDCGCKEFDKETDIFDVWFDSGCSHAAVCREREELVWPADLYLEGADQYRGWFQSSLNVSVAVYGEAPYKAVCTHGWVVDGKGEQIHKSKGNAVPPEQVISKYGADVLRLWVASTDFHADIRISNDIIGQIAETYRKFRNTARFMLSNLGGFDPNEHLLPVADLESIDSFALAKFDELRLKILDSYEAFDYCKVYHSLNAFCVLHMSNFYLDIIKDRLYCEKADGRLRRSAQTALYLILSGLTRLAAPILVFTADEIWREMPHLNGEEADSALLNLFPEATGGVADKKWETIAAIRLDVLAALEQKRAAKVIGKSLEAKVTLFTDKDLSAELPELAAAFIVSHVEVKSGKGEYTGDTCKDTLSVTIDKADGGKCDRCWTYSADTKDGLCHRCAKALA